MTLDQKVQLALHCFKLAAFLATFVAGGVGVKFLLQGVRCHARRFARQQSLWSNWT